MQMVLSKNKMWKWIAAALMIMVAGLIVSATVQAAEVTDQSHKPSSFDRSQQVGTISNVGYSLYQTFEVGTTGKLSAVEFYKVGQVGSIGLGNLNVQIVQLDTNGKPTESIVVGTKVNNPIANGWQRAEFVTPTNVTVGEKYAIKFSCSNCGNGTYFTLGDTLTVSNPTLGYSKGSLWKKRTNNVNYFNNVNNDLGFSTVVYVPSTNANAAAIELSAGELSPTFSNSELDYDATIANNQANIQVKATTENDKATIELNGTAILSGQYSTEIPMSVGDNNVEVKVIAEDGTTTSTFNINIYREPVAVSIISPSTVLNVADATPTITGGAYEGAEIDVYIDSNLVGQTTAGSDGEWIYEISSDLLEGPHSLTVVDYNYPLNTATSSFTVDVSGPVLNYEIETLKTGDWYTEDVIIHFTCSDALSAVEVCPVSTTLSENGAGQSVNVTATDSIGNSTTITVEDINIDKIGPVITYSLSVLANANGWYTSDVTIEFLCSDDLSGTNVCPAAQTLSLEQFAQSVTVSATDLVGNTSELTISDIHIDKTSPILNYLVSGDLSDTWYSSEVTVEFYCDDEVSGIEECPSLITLGESGIGQTVIATVFDKAGNSTTVTIENIDIDKDGPVVSVIITPENNSYGWHNSSVTMEYSCADSLSGVAECPVSKTVNEEGAGQMISAEAYDQAGNITIIDTFLNIDLTAPTFEYTLDGTLSNGWYSSDVIISFTCNDELSGVEDCPASYTISAEGLTSGLTFTIYDLAGNSATITIQDIMIDKTSPTITASVVTEANDFGWYNTPVEVAFDCFDAGSGVESCTDTQFITTEGLNQSLSGTSSDLVGNNSNITVSAIDIDMTAPEVTYTVSGLGNGVWYTSDVTISFTCSDNLSGVIECPADIVIGEEGLTTGEVYMISDFAGNVFTITVEDIMIDKTAPVITGAATTEPNANGWYNNAVTVEFNCSDELSGIATCSESAQFNESIQDGSTNGTATDNAGNETTVSVEDINIDLEAPEVTYTVSGLGNGVWYTSDVTISFTCSDNLSGVTECPADIVIGEEGLTVGATYTVTDFAGNLVTITVEDIMIDKTAPVITGAATTEPNANGWYTTPVTINFQCSDNNSGINVCPASETINQSGASLSVTGTATDKAGNSATTTISNLKVDLTAPTAIADLRKGSQTTTSITLLWSAATDNIGVTAYEVYRNSILVATVTTGLTYTDSGIVENTPYVYTIKALDAAGYSTSSNSLTATLVSTNKATIYYKVPASWSGNAFIHYRPNGGVWTVSPGTRMNASAINGYHVITIDLGTATGLRAAFTNGISLWDNNATNDYTILMGTSTVENNTVKIGEPFIDTVAPAIPTSVATTQVQATSVTVNWTASTDNVGVKSYQVFRNGTLLTTVTNNRVIDNSVVANTTYSYTIRAIDEANNISESSAPLTITTAANNTIKIFYKVPVGSVSYIHYRPIGGTWTVSPGMVMSASTFAGYNVITLNIGNATSVEAAFNNGSGTWDNNSTRNYTFQLGTFNLNNRVITSGEPVIDTIAPTLPTNVATSNVTRTSFTATWTGSTDNIAVKGYNVYLNGAYIATVTNPTYSFTGLAANTNYSLRVLAFDAANNRSAQTTAVTVKTLTN